MDASAYRSARLFFLMGIRDLRKEPRSVHVAALIRHGQQALAELRHAYYRGMDGDL